MKLKLADLRKPFLNHFFSKTTDAKELLQRFKAIQIDPLTIVSKNHLLVISARNHHLKSDSLDALYKEKDVAEVFAKERCLVPSVDAYLHFPRLLENKNKDWQSKPLIAYKEEAKAILKLAKEKGVISISDFQNKKWISNHSWQSSNIYTALISALHETGELIIVSRNDRKLLYSLPPKNFWSQSKIKGEELRIKRYEEYLCGSLITDTRDTFAGFERSSVKERTHYFKTLLNRGIALEVEDSKSLTIVSKKIFLENQTPVNNLCLPVFIPPLDNSIWQRYLIEDLWQFKYRWEIYTPEHKRIIGPFAMPLVTSDGFFGPMDFKFDRKQKTLIARLSTSPLNKGSHKLKALMEEAVQKLATTLEAENIEYL